MPISKYNPDGTVDIYNSKTGQTKASVKPEELGMISPKLVAEYQVGQTPEKLLARTKAEKELADIASAVPGEVKPTAEQQFRLSAASQAVNRLEETFGRGSSEKVGTKEDLSLAGSATIFGKGAAKIGEIGKKVFDSKYQEDLNIFRSALENAKGIFTQAFGSGTPQAFEATTFLTNAPGPTSTDRETREWFNTVRAFLGEAKKTEGQQAVDQATGQKKNEVVSPIQQPQKDTFMQGVARKVGGAAPVVLGTLGGIGGGIVGGIAGIPALGVGAIPGAAIGSAAGTGLGVGAGVAIQNTLEDIAGIQDESSQKQVTDMVKKAGVASVTDLILGGAFSVATKAGGLVLRSLGKIVDDIPLKNIRVNPTQILNFVKKHGEDLGQFLVKNRLLGENALDLAAGKAGQLQKAFDNLALSTKVEIPIDELNKRFVKEIQDLAPSVEKLVPSQFKDIAKNVTKEWKFQLDQIKNKGITMLNPEMITNLRRMTDDLIPDSAWVDPGVKNVAIRLRRIYSDVVTEAVDKTLLTTGGETAGAGLSQLGRELSKYYDFLEIAQKQAGLGRGSLLLNLPRLLAGGLGAMVGMGAGPAGAGAGAVLGGITLEALSRDPTILKTAYQAGKAARKLSPAMEAAGKAVRTFIPAAGAAVGASL